MSYLRSLFALFADTCLALIVSGAGTVGQAGDGINGYYELHRTSLYENEPYWIADTQGSGVIYIYYHAYFLAWYIAPALSTETYAEFMARGQGISPYSLDMDIWYVFMLDEEFSYTYAFFHVDPMVDVHCEGFEIYKYIYIYISVCTGTAYIYIYIYIYIIYSSIN